MINNINTEELKNNGQLCKKEIDVLVQSVLDLKQMVLGLSNDWNDDASAAYITAFNNFARELSKFIECCKDYNSEYISFASSVEEIETKYQAMD